MRAMTLPAPGQPLVMADLPQSQPQPHELLLDGRWVPGA